MLRSGCGQDTPGPGAEGLVDHEAAKSRGASAFVRRGGEGIDDLPGPGDLLFRRGKDPVHYGDMARMDEALSRET